LDLVGYSSSLLFATTFLSLLMKNEYSPDCRKKRKIIEIIEALLAAFAAFYGVYWVYIYSALSSSLEIILSS